MKSSTLRAVAIGGALSFAAAFPEPALSSDRELLRQTKGTYAGTATLRIEGESISGDALLTMPRRRGRISGRIDPDDVNKKFSGTVNRVVVRRRVVVYYGRLRIRSGEFKLSGEFKAKARVRGDRVKISLPISAKRDTIFGDITAQGRFRGDHL